MRTISLQAIEADPALLTDIAATLKKGGLVCFPFSRQYSIAASLLSEAAVIKLVQSKQRVARAPALVLIPDQQAASQLTEALPAVAHPLFAKFWPGALTMMLSPSASLPKKVLRTMASDKMGVRVPAPGLPLRLVQAFGGPLLTSSANVTHKTGATSVAAVKQKFGRLLDILIDAGDLKPQAPSTVVEVEDLQLKILREGSISAEEIRSVLSAAGMSASFA